VNRKPLSILAGAVILASAAGPALAHPGHAGGDSLMAGLAHPFSGLDHLLAMTAVGLWAGLSFPRRWWALPASFVGFMLAGFVLGQAGGPLPLIEAAIAVSLVGLGLAVWLQLKPPAALGAAVVALFALVHGYAHGQELPAGGDGLRFALGFGLSTAVLHGLGLALSWAALKFEAGPLARLGGLGVAAIGAAMLLIT